LGTLFWLKTLRVAKKPQLIFWNKISTGFPWNLEHSLLVENFACGKKTAVDFLEQNFHRLCVKTKSLEINILIIR
jgi:hypothetical protein